MSEKYLGR